MIKSLKLQNFTVFKSADFTFSPGINVIIGENGSGKSHLLKLLYAVNRAANRSVSDPKAKKPELGKFFWECYTRLQGVFKPDDLKNLQRKPRSGECSVDIDLGKGSVHLDIFAKTPPMIGNDHPDNIKAPPPIFLPAKEILSIFPGLIALFEYRHLAFDDTYRDLALSLGLPLLREEHLNGVRPFIDSFEKLLGGKVVLDNDRFYIDRGKKGRLEINLLAEGLRKLAAVVQLLGNGSIKRDMVLFWDEPEANLNPRLQLAVVEVLKGLAELGVQVFLATHSLFLMKELALTISGKKKPEIRYFSLKLNKGTVEVQSENDLLDLADITSLDESISQGTREQHALWGK